MNPIEITPQTLILVGVTCIVLGFVANVLLNTLRDEENLPEGDPAGNDAAPPGGRKGRYEVVARLWRERGTGRLIVEKDGKSYVNPTPLDEKQRDALETAARDLRGWLGMPAVAPADRLDVPPAAPELPIVSPVSLPAVTTEPAAPASAAAPVVPPAQPRPPAPVQSIAKPAPAGQAKKDQPSGADKSAPAISTKSIVAQIEDVLQDRIAGTPLGQLDIHLQEDTQRGVMVKVGAEYYEGIDAVPDPQIKAAIQAAVAAWEKGQ